MKSVKIKQYMASRLAIICTGAFLLAAVITAISDIFDVPALVAKVLPLSVAWMYPAVDAFIVLIVGAFAVYLVSQLVLERTKMEEELKLKAQLLDAATDSILLYRPDGSFVYVNEAAYKSRGYSREQLMAINRRNLAAPEFAKLFDSRLKEIMDKRESTFESVHLREDGTRMPVEIHARTTEVGGEDLILSVCRDITERKQVEETLRESEERFRSIVENSHEGIMILDDAYRFTYVNDELCRISGYPREEIIGQDFRQFLDEESRQLVADRYIRRQRGEEVPQRYEFNFVHKNGGKRRVEIGSAIIKDSAGRVKTVAQILDINERKQAEEALKLQTAYFQQLFDNSPDAILLLDDSNRIVNTNQGFEMLFGYPTEEVKGRIISEVIVSEDHVEEAFTLGKAIHNNEVVRKETVRKRKDDSLVDVSILGYPIRFGNKTVGQYVIYSDITERKQAEEVFKTLATSSPIGIYVVQDRAFQFVSPQFQELVGYSEDELLGMDSLTPVHPEDREMVRENAIRMLKEEHSSPYEYRYISKDGQTKWVMETVASIQYRGRRATLGNFLDVTERKQAEEELKLRAQILDGATDSIFLNDLDGNIIYVNEAGCRAHGYSREELTNMNIRQLLEPEQSKNFNPADTSYLEILESDRVNFELSHLRKDGSIMPVEIHGRIIESGGRKLSISVIRDITRRKQAEEELKLRAQILDGATDSIFVHDSEGNFIYVNEAACRAHGYSREELMKMKLQQVIAPDRVSRLESDFQEMLEKGEAVFESAHLRKDGSIMPSEVHGRTIESGGRKLFLTVIRDITERKQAEEERRELENRTHLNSRLASIGEIAAGIAHEINNPLTAVIGFAQLLMDTTIPDDAKKDIAVIYKEARRAAEVAKNLLVFARKREPVRQPTDINSAIQEVLKLRAYEEKVNNIQVNTRFASKLPEVMADYSQLQQVFLNIIINAEAAMLEAHNGGALTVTTQKVNGTIKVSFNDNGPGIAKENLERVFDPFFTTKEVGKGTGLGLSLCHGIVVQHGGRIYAKSKWGKGSTFVVELPINAH